MPNDEKENEDGPFQRLLDLVPLERREEVKKIADALGIREGSELFPLACAMGSYTLLLKETPKKLAIFSNDFDRTAARIQGTGSKMSVDAQTLVTANSEIKQTAARFENIVHALTVTKFNKDFFYYLLSAFAVGAFSGALVSILLLFKR